jgi:hypothetical protein
VIAQVINNSKPVFLIVRGVLGRDELAGVVVGKMHGNANATQVKTSFFGR